MKKISIKNIILISFALLMAAASVLLPGFLVHKETMSYYGKVKEVPAEYYSGPSESIIKNASKQLKNEQCIQLITGVWDSTVTPVDPEDCTYSEFAIKTMIISHVQNLYTKQLYPCSLSSKSDNWYSWEAKPYRALDDTFRTYGAYFWDVTFTRYDGNETHRFIVSEFGDIIYAEANTKENFGGFSPDLSNASYLFDYSRSTTFYTTYSVDDSTSGIITSVTYDDESKSYKTDNISTTTEKAKAISKQIASSGSFITGFEAFEPDKIVSLTQTGGASTPIKYSVSSKATYNSYKMILIPEKEK